MGLHDCSRVVNFSKSCPDGQEILYKNSALYGWIVCSSFSFKLVLLCLLSFI